MTSSVRPSTPPSRSSTKRKAYDSQLDKKKLEKEIYALQKSLGEVEMPNKKMIPPPGMLFRLAFMEQHPHHNFEVEPMKREIHEKWKEASDATHGRFVRIYEDLVASYKEDCTLALEKQGEIRMELARKILNYKQL